MNKRHGGRTVDDLYGRIRAKSDAHLGRQHEQDAETSVVLTRTALTTLVVSISIGISVLLEGPDIGGLSQVILLSVSVAPGIVSLILRVRNFFRN